MSSSRKESVFETVFNFFGGKKKNSKRTLPIVSQDSVFWSTNGSSSLTPSSMANLVPPSPTSSFGPSSFQNPSWESSSRKASMQSSFQSPSRKASMRSSYHSLEAYPSFHDLVQSSLAELNYKIIKEFDRVRREDTLRMKALEAQIISSGGTVEAIQESFTRTSNNGEPAIKGLSVEACLDRDKAIDRMKSGSFLNSLSSSLAPLRLPDSDSRPLGVRSAPGSKRQSRTSMSARSRGGSLRPVKPEIAKPKGPDKAPPVLQPVVTTWANDRGMPEPTTRASDHDMPKRMTSKDTMVTSSSEAPSDYMGRTEIMSIAIRKTESDPCVAEVAEAAEETLTAKQSVVPVVAPGPRDDSLKEDNDIGNMPVEVKASEVFAIPTTLPSSVFGGAGKHLRISEISASSHITDENDSGTPRGAPQKFCSFGGATSLSVAPERTSSATPCLVKHHPSAGEIMGHRPTDNSRKSCRFDETPFSEKVLTMPSPEPQEDCSSSDVSFDDDAPEGEFEFSNRRTSAFAPRTLRNSLEGVRFQLLPIWSETEKGSIKRRNLGYQMQERMDDNTSEDSHEWDSEHSSKRKRGMAKFIVQPNTGKRIPWDYAAVFLVAYECVVIPLQYAEIRQTDGLTVMGWIVRIFWSIDIPVCFLTGYVLKDGTNEMRPAYVVANYLKSWFLLDFILVCSDWLEALIHSMHFVGATRSLKLMKTLRLLRMVRIVRLTRFKRSEFMDSWMESMFKPDVIPVLISVLKIVAVFAWMNHLMACLWVKLGEGQHGETNWITGHEYTGAPKDYIYSCAYHWSLQQFSGAAEVWPWNRAERNFAVATGVITFVAAAGFVSSLTSSMTHFEIVTSQDSRRIAQLKHWLYDCGISNTVAMRVQRNAQHALQEEKKNMPESSIELLPIISEPLRMEIHYDMHMQVLATHAFFRLSNEVSAWMMRHVCHEATHVLSLSRGDMLFCDGEISQEPRMYFIKSGDLQYSHNTGRRELAVAGCWASEGGVWTSWTHCGGMLATTDCQLLVLEVSKFQNITGQFYKQKEFGKQYGLLFVRHLNSCNMDELTDLEDDEMDIEWLAARSCPHLVKQSGLMAKIMRKGSQSDLDTPRARGGSMAFMGMNSVERALKKCPEIGRQAGRGSVHSTTSLESNPNALSVKKTHFTMNNVPSDEVSADGF